MNKLFVTLSLIFTMQASLHAMNLEQQLHQARIDSLHHNLSNAYKERLMHSVVRAFATAPWLRASIQYSNDIIPTVAFGAATLITYLKFGQDIAKIDEQINVLQTQIKTLEQAIDSHSAHHKNSKFQL